MIDCLPIPFASAPHRNAGLRAATGAVLGLLLASGLAARADAQSVDCGQMQAQIIALSHVDPSRSLQYLRAAQKQQSELDRTLAYANSIGCNNRQFLFFGQAPPPQCNTINPQIQRMKANLDQLNAQARAAGAGADAQRRDLTVRYDNYCRGNPPPQQHGFLDGLFGGGAPENQPDPNMPNVPIIAPPPEQSASGGSKAVCVRSCDGGFFPVSYSAGRANLENLSDLCHALCPNAETTLFTYSPSGDIDHAVSIDGKPYSSLANADKFKTKFDPSCTCKPPDQSWAQALTDAERILGSQAKSDIYVTPEKSAELSRPSVAVSPAPVTAKGAKSKAAAAAAAAAAGQTDDLTAAEGALAGQAPTASTESAGIQAGRLTAGPAYTTKDGKETTVVEPDGVKKQVRIIDPAL